jgi:hypothetical protein
MFLRSNLLLPAGTRVSLAFEAKGQPLPFAEAEVIWQRAPTADGGTAGFALRFTRFLNQRGPELVEQLVSLGRNKLAEAEAKLAREAAPEPVRQEEEAPTVQAAARPPPAPLDATPPEPAPSVRPPPAGKQPAFVKPTGPLSVGVPRPVSPLDASETETGSEAEADAGGEEVSLHEFEGSSSLRATKLRGPSAGALALLVAVPLVIAVAAWRASTTSEPALAVLEKPAAPPTPAATATAAPAPAASAPAPTVPETPAAAAAEPAPVVKELPPAPAKVQAPVEVVAAAPAAPAQQPVAAVPAPAPTPPETARTATPPAAAVARTEKPERTEKTAEKPAPREKAAATGSVKLGQGAVSAASLKGSAQKLELDLELLRGARIRRAFALKGPHRLVVDVEGGRAAKSLERSVAQVPGVTRARVGPQPGGVTRLVLDLTRPAGKVTHGGDRVSVSW